MKKIVKKIIDFLFCVDDNIGNPWKEESKIIHNKINIKTEVNQLMHFAKLFCPAVYRGNNLFERHNQVIYDALYDKIRKLNKELSALDEKHKKLHCSK